MLILIFTILCSKCSTWRTAEWRGKLNVQFQKYLRICLCIRVFHWWCRAPYKHEHWLVVTLCWAVWQCVGDCITDRHWHHSELFVTSLASCTGFIDVCRRAYVCHRQHVRTWTSCGRYDRCSVGHCRLLSEPEPVPDSSIIPHTPTCCHTHSRTVRLRRWCLAWRRRTD